MDVSKKTLSIIGVIALIAVLAIFYFILIKEDSTDEPGLKDTVEEAKIPAMPQSLAEAEEALKDPQDLLAVLNEYFIIEQRPGLLALSPEEFLEARSGNAHDFAVFVSHIMWQNGIEAGVIRFNYQAEDQEGTHSVAVFRDQGGRKYLTVTDKGCQMFDRGSFEETVRVETERLKVVPTEYTFFPADFEITDLSEPAPYRKWIKLD